MTTERISYDLVEFGKPLQKRSVQIADPSGTEVLLRIIRSGVCHSDLHMIEGEFDLGEEGVLRMVDRGMKLPLTLGHEILGEIVAAGPAAGEVTAGRRMLVFPWLGCGKCVACDDERENDCMAMRIIGLVQNGGYASHILVESPEILVDVHDQDPDTIAPHACSGLTVYNALGKFSKPNKANWLAIMGAGGLGLNAVCIAKALGFENIVAVDINDSKLESASELGARKVLNASGDGAIEQLRELTGNRLLSVLDTVGAPSTARLGVHALIKGGHYVVVGLHGGDFKMPQPWLAQKAMTVQGSHVGSCQQLRKLVGLIRTGTVQKMPVTLRPLDEVNEALQDLREGKVNGRVVLTFD